MGAATAWQVQQRWPDRLIVVLDREPEPGMRQSSRNSGALHSGIYYRPGSLKAKNCTTGRAASPAATASLHIGAHLADRLG